MTEKKKFLPQLIQAALISGAITTALIGVFFTIKVSCKKLLITSQQEWKS